MRRRRSGDRRRALDEMADADLVERSRAGDTDAFGELWRRHYPSGIAVARSVTSSLDADDLVQEAYTRIYRSIRQGGGPTGSFRAYLFTSIRNTAAAWGRSRRETAIDDLDAVPDPQTEEEAAAEALDHGLTHQAFRSLPTRWQEVLWYTEIEQLKPAEVAPLLGMRANAVAQLAVRAREGLRTAWIQAHLRSVADGSPCQWTIERLGAYARGTLGKRDRGKVDAHLHDCARCAIVAAEAKDVSDRLALVLLPLTLGAGAAGYAAWLQAGVPVAAVAGMPSTVVQGAVVGGAGTGLGGAGSGLGGAGSGMSAGASAGGGAFAGAGATAGLVAAGVLIAATVAVAAVVVPGALMRPTSGAAQFSAHRALPEADASDADVVGKEPDPDHLPTAPELKKPETPPVPAPHDDTPRDAAPPADEPPAQTPPVEDAPISVDTGSDGVPAITPPALEETVPTAPVEEGDDAGETVTPDESLPGGSTDEGDGSDEVAEPDGPQLPEGMPTLIVVSRHSVPLSASYTLRLSVTGAPDATIRAVLSNGKSRDYTLTDGTATVTVTSKGLLPTTTPFAGVTLSVFYVLDERTGKSLDRDLSELWDQATEAPDDSTAPGDGIPGLDGSGDASSDGDPGDTSVDGTGPADADDPASATTDSVPAEGADEEDPTDETNSAADDNTTDDTPSATADSAAAEGADEEDPTDETNSAADDNMTDDTASAMTDSAAAEGAASP